MSTDISLTRAQRLALIDLRNNATLSSRTQLRLSSGRKINSVVDDAVNYFKAKSLSDNATDFGNLRDDIGQAITHLEVTIEAVSALEKILGQIKGTLEAARSQSAAERRLANNSIVNLGQQIVELTQDANYGGSNLINNTALGRTVRFGTRTNSKLDLPGLNFLEGGRAATEAYDAATTQVTAYNITASANEIADRVVEVGNGALGTGLATGQSNEEQQAARERILAAYVAGSGDKTARDVTNGTEFDALRGLTGTNILYKGTSYATFAAFETAYLAAEKIRVRDEVEYIHAQSTADSRLFASVDVFDVNGGLGTFRFEGFLIGATSLTAVGTNNSQLTVVSETIKRLDDAIARIRGHAQSLGSNVAILQTREVFTDNYVTLNTVGAEKYLLADLNEEGANLVALQTRQQLGIQALSVAGQQQRAILTLLQ